MYLNLPRIWSGSFTIPGHGNWPGTIQIHVRSQPTPKFDGFSLFCSSFSSARTCSLEEEKNVHQPLSKLKISCVTKCVITWTFQLFPNNVIKFPPSSCYRCQWVALSHHLQINSYSLLDTRYKLYGSMIQIYTYHKCNEWMAMESYFWMKLFVHSGFCIEFAAHTKIQSPCIQWRRNRKR